METNNPPAGGANPPASTPPATPPAIFSNGLEFAPNWHEQLPEEMRASVAGTRSLTELVGRFKGQRDEIAARGPSIRIPGDKASDVERETFQKEVFKHLGIPQTAEEYEIPVPDGQEADKELIGLLTGLGPQIGLSKQAAATLATKYNEHMAARVKAVQDEQAAAQAADVKALGEKLGAGTDAAVALVKEAAARHGWPAEAFDPTSPDFVGGNAFLLIHGLALDLAKASGSDRTGTNGTMPNRRDRAWAVRVQQGLEPESEYIKEGHPRYKETWAAIEAAYKAEPSKKK